MIAHDLRLRRSAVAAVLRAAQDQPVRGFLILFSILASLVGLLFYSTSTAHALLML